MNRVIAGTASALVLVSTLSQAATVQRVSFEHGGQVLSANLYLPESYKAGQKLLGVVVTGSWTSVKEQMAGHYASALADQGYAALAFDFRGWGESKDALMYVEDPARKTDDIIAAANFLAKKNEVDSTKIAGLGVCASAGYIADAALASDTIKSIALVAPWLHDAEIVDAVYGGSEGVDALIKLSRDAEQKYTSTGLASIVTAASETDTTAVMQGATYYTDTDRGLIPEYDNKFNLMTWEPWLRYDAIKTSKALEKATLIVHSDAAAIPMGAKKFAENMGDNAEQLWLENVTQFDFYDNPAYVGEAVSAVTQHFAKTLK